MLGDRWLSEAMYIGDVAIVVATRTEASVGAKATTRSNSDQIILSEPSPNWTRLRGRSTKPLLARTKSPQIPLILEKTSVRYFKPNSGG